MPVSIESIRRGDSVEVVLIPGVGGNTSMVFDGLSPWVRPISPWTMAVFEVLGIHSKSLDRVLINIVDPGVFGTEGKCSAPLIDKVGGIALDTDPLKDLRTWWVHERAIQNVLRPAAAITVVTEPPGNCGNCGAANEWGAINQPDGSFHCYPCRQDPYGRRIR